MKIFVDTAAWLALLNSRDILHKDAQQVMNQLQKQKASLITTDFVLLEVADALSTPPNRSQTIGFLDSLLNLSEKPALRIIPATRAILITGWTLYKQRQDKDWGLTDCISFAVMQQEKITKAFTSDRHFEQAGFAKLL